ncbi:MAG: DUF5343 domain-containing protein [Gammaproteobacteria bacterium]
MLTESNKYSTPPYVPYTTFISFINGLSKTGIPSHIDRSIMETMSGSGQSAMIATLKALRLVNAELEPLPDLESLVNGSDGDFNTTLNKLVKSTYSFLFDGSINIENTTSKKVEEKFRSVNVSGSTLTKCISFFLAASKAADIKVSQHIKAPKIQRSASASSKKKNIVSKTQNNPLSDQDSVPPLHENMEKITISLPSLGDGYIYFPAGMDEDQSKLAVKMAKFMLDNYYGIQDGN